MARSVRELCFGSRPERRRGTLGAVIVCLGTFAGYASGLFATTGGVLVLPGDATAVGLVLAGVIGYRRGPAVVAWALPFAAYVGFTADWAFFGLSGHELAGKLAFLFDPTRATVLATAAVIFGAVGYGAGRLCRAAVQRLDLSG